MAEPFDSEWWEERISGRVAAAGTPSEATFWWRRWRLVDELLQRYYHDFGLQPIFAWMGAEIYQIGLASPTCARAARYFGRLCATGVHKADSVDNDMLGAIGPNGKLTELYSRSHRSVEFHNPIEFDEFLKRAIELLELADAGVVGHERCFHRRGRDFTPLMYRVALLLRTDERDGPLRNNEMWSVHPWTDGAKPSERRDDADRVLQEHGESVPAGPPRFVAVLRNGHTTVIANDGRVFGETGRVDAADLWRRGMSHVAIAETVRDLQGTERDNELAF